MEVKQPTKSEETVKTESVVKTQLKTSSEAPFTANERVPSNWSITADGDMIEARHNVTLRVFKGTIAQFNTLLRG
jgi:hypothetical protein